MPSCVGDKKAPERRLGAFGCAVEQISGGDRSSLLLMLEQIGLGYELRRRDLREQTVVLGVEYKAGGVNGVRDDRRLRQKDVNRLAAFVDVKADIREIDTCIDGTRVGECDLISGEGHLMPPELGVVGDRRRVGVVVRLRDELAARLDELVQRLDGQSDLRSRVHGLGNDRDRFAAEECAVNTESTEQQRDKDGERAENIELPHG